MTKSGRYISDERIQKKYELTPIIEDDEYMKEYMMNTLKDFRNDAPTREHEFNRKSSEANGVIDRRYGRKTDNDIYKPDLFLGDLSKDPRSLADSADLNGFRKFMEHRKEALKVNLLNDDNLAVNSKTMTHAEARRNKDEAFRRKKEKYTNYENSIEGIKHGKSLFNLSNGGSNLDKNVSAVDYIINTHKDTYTNRDKKNKNGKWLKEFSHNGNDGFIDYSSGKKSREEIHADNVYGGVKIMSPFQISKNSRNSNISHNINQIDERNKINSVDHFKSERPSISNFVERKLESLDNAKLTSKDNYIKLEKNNKNKDNIRDVRQDMGDVEQSHKIANASKFLLERLNRNNLITKQHESMVNRDGNSLTHKIKYHNSKELNPVAKKVSMEEVKNIIRLSTFTGDRRQHDSKEHNQAIFSKGSNKILNQSQEVLKFAIMNPDMDSTKKGRDELFIYNYKSKQPEKIKFVENAGEMEIGLYSHTKESFTMDKHGNKSGAVGYEIQNVENSEMEQKPSHYDQRETKMAAGVVGKMGSKFIRDKIDREDMNTENMEIVSRR